MVLFGVVLCFVIGTIFLNNSSFATTSDDVVETNFFGNYVEDDEGCGVYMVLDLIIDILSMGVVIAGVIGVTIAGIQYMSAKDSEEKTRKAKNRIFEIVIGLVVYAVLFVGAQWLLPGGMMNQKCRKISNEQLAQMKEDERKKEEERKKKEEEERINKENEEKAKEQRQEEQQKAKDYNRCMERAAKVVRDKICKIEDPSERIAKTAKLLAGSKNYSTYVTAMNQTKSNYQYDYCQKIGKSCNTYVATVLLASGVDPNIPKGKYGNSTANLVDYFDSSSKWKCVSHNPQKSKEGDVVIKAQNHVTITVRNSQGKLVTAHAGHCTPVLSCSTSTTCGSNGAFFPKIDTYIYTGYSNPCVYRYQGETIHAITGVGTN